MDLNFGVTSLSYSINEWLFDVIIMWPCAETVSVSLVFQDSSRSPTQRRRRERGALGWNVPRATPWPPGQRRRRGRVSRALDDGRCCPVDERSRQRVRRLAATTTLVSFHVITTFWRGRSTGRGCRMTCRRLYPSSPWWSVFRCDCGSGSDGLWGRRLVAAATSERFETSIRPVAGDRWQVSGLIYVQTRNVGQCPTWWPPCRI